MNLTCVHNSYVTQIIYKYICYRRGQRGVTVVEEYVLHGEESDVL